MATQIVISVITVLLLIYAVWLRIRLSKRDQFIATTVNRLSGIEQSRSMEEITEFLDELHKSTQYSSFFKDKFFDKSTSDFIFDDIQKMKVFLHYTRAEEDAKRISSEGFRFAESFHRTALPVSNDTLDLKIRHNERKLFGDYLVVICISADLVNYYTEALGKAGKMNCSFENVMTENSPRRNENSDLVYQLPPQFIKGYINHRSGRIVRNNRFDPFYNSPAFEKNIGLLN